MSIPEIDEVPEALAFHLEELDIIADDEPARLGMLDRLAVFTFQELVVGIAAGREWRGILWRLEVFLAASKVRAKEVFQHQLPRWKNGRDGAWRCKMGVCCCHWLIYR